VVDATMVVVESATFWVITVDRADAKKSVEPWYFAVMLCAPVVV